LAITLHFIAPLSALTVNNVGPAGNRVMEWGRSQEGGLDWGGGGWQIVCHFAGVLPRKDPSLSSQGVGSWTEALHGKQGGLVVF
jgi:hypothetical protein